MYPNVPSFVNVRVTEAPSSRSESNESSRFPHPLSALPATRARLWFPPVLVNVTVPPTLIVVTAVPLASSFHLLPAAVLTVAVVGAVDAGAEAAGAAVGAAG